MEEGIIIDRLNELLRSIRRRPEIYIGEKSLFRLFLFIQGFLHAYHTMEGTNQSVGFYPGFQEWIQEKYNINSAQNWSRIIGFFSISEADAFDNFYKLLDEYQVNTNR
jgi:hypothetical protein